MASQFNKDIYNKNLKDMRESFDLNNYKDSFYTWVIDVASGFPTDQVVVGILDKNDIIQECFLAFENAWNNLDWDAIHGTPEDERQPMVWAFLKKSIKLKVGNRLTQFKDGIKATWNNGVNPNSVDDFLTILFPDFFKFDHATSIWGEAPSLWDVEKLSEGLYQSMHAQLSDVDRMTLELFYGLDGIKKTLKEIADMFNTNQNAITVKKKRNLKKLDNDLTREIIRKNFE